MPDSRNSLSEQDKLLLEVGRCLNTWSNIEFNLSAIYTTMFFLTDNENQSTFKVYNALRASFDSVVSFDARVAMATVAVQQGPHSYELIKKNWSSLSKRMLKKYKKRNGVAHFETREIERYGQKKFALHPFLTYTKSFPEAGRIDLTLSDLTQRLKSFEALSSEIGAYAVYSHVRTVQDPDARKLAERLRQRLEKTGGESPEEM